MKDWLNLYAITPAGSRGLADAMKIVAQNILSTAAENTRTVFGGRDGPLVARMLVDTDKSLTAWRRGEFQKSLDIMRKLEVAVLESESEFFTLNDFHERWFMVGRARDSRRGFNEIVGIYNIARVE